MNKIMTYKDELILECIIRQIDLESYGYSRDLEYQDLNILELEALIEESKQSWLEVYNAIHGSDDSRFNK